MPILSTDILFFLSGGATNADPNASLGGVISANQVGAGLNNLFDDVSGAESAAGDVEYRCIYVQNAHATLTLQAAKIFINANTPSADTTVDIAIDGNGIGDGGTTGVAEVVADESTAPTGEVFTSANGEVNALNIGDLAPGEVQAIWVRRTINAGAAAYSGDNADIQVKGDTAA